MAVSTPFSSQNTTIEVFDYSTYADILSSAISIAMQTADSTQRMALLQSAYATFFTGLSASVTAVGTGINSASDVGDFYGKWSRSAYTYVAGAGSAVGKSVLAPYSGTFSSTATTTTSITADFTVSGSSFIPELDVTDLQFTTTPSGTITPTTFGTGISISTTVFVLNKLYKTGAAITAASEVIGLAKLGAPITPKTSAVAANIPTGTVFLCTSIGTGAAGAATSAVLIQPSTVPTVAYTAVSKSSGYLIGKVTAAGDTGKTYAAISAKLLNEGGTYKAKGSSDEGDFTIDFLKIPSDIGQQKLLAAFNDESANANRVFRITHNSSGSTVANSEKVYFMGLVTECKQTRGAIDSFVNVKSKIVIQNGLYEDNPA